MLEKYLKKFANLRTDKNKNRYPATTRNRAPHKPILLLSVTDLIDESGTLNRARNQGLSSYTTTAAHYAAFAC